MNARRSFLIQLLAVALAIAMSLAALPFLHGLVPIHWDLAGRPDAWAAPAFALGLMPLVLAGVAATSFALAHRGVRSGRELLAGLAATAVFLLGVHGLTLGAAVFRTLFPIRPLLALVFGFFAGISPIVARVEQNPWFGVRTSWTLGSRRVWRETHRATGRLWLVGGIVGSGLTLFGAPFGLIVLLLVALALAPVAISYGVWRRLERR